ncbi:hypothetical protein [Streptomyces sp. NPDC004267]|uniref:hypothetical protein n=1 Tax=Streptomyces sp. NPDC004267 TaxID=3364694 RepID=UPI0036CC350F
MLAYDRPAPSLPTVVTVLLCGRCGTDPFTARSDRRFHCPCGHVLAARDIDLDGDETWCVTPAGQLAYLPGADAALERYRAALTVMNDKGKWGSELEAAHTEFLAALAVLEAARLMGVRLPEDGTVEIGRVYIAAVVEKGYRYQGDNAHALGWPCETCAPRSIDPMNQKAYPCRNPRGHAWRTVEGWRLWGDRRDTCTYRVLSPIAPDLMTGRARARAKVAAQRAGWLLLSA